MRASGSGAKLGLIGSGIKYSLSPQIHDASMKHLGIEGSYQIIDVPSMALAEYLDIAWNSGATGFNVTTPHKREVAKLIGDGSLESVNTLFRGESGWSATSTDGPGLDQAIQNKCGKRLKDYEQIVFLGDGGVVAGVMEYVQASRTSEAAFTIHARSSKFADTLAGKKFSNCITIGEWTSEALSQTLAQKSKETILIQASSAPQKSENLSWLVPALSSYSGDYAELTYNCESALEVEARRKGLRVISGIDMLVEQARKSQDFWWGKSAPTSVILDALNAIITKK